MLGSARILAAVGAFSAVLTFPCEAAAQAAIAARSEYGSWGVDLDGVDTTVKPGADFFRYVNGRWLDRTPIPADKADYSLFETMRDVTERRLHALLDSASASAHHDRTPTTVAGKVGAFYRSFLDSTRVEQLGVAPVAPLLAAIRDTRTQSQLAELMGRGAADF
jgi:putative endopeptidase